VFDLPKLIFFISSSKFIQKSLEYFSIIKTCSKQIICIVKSCACHAIDTEVWSLGELW